VKLVEPFIGRSLGFGDLQILTSSGKAGADEFKTVAGASRLRTAIQEQKARSEERRTEVAAAAVAAAAAPAMAAPAPAAPAPAPVPLSAADEAANSLKLLADLRQQGLVTDEEYEAKRAEIVARF
jgi:hypothetical protein